MTVAAETPPRFLRPTVVGPPADEAPAQILQGLLAEQEGCHQPAEPIVARAAKLAGYPGVDRPDELFVALLRATATVERALAGGGELCHETLQRWVRIHRQAPRGRDLYLALMGPITSCPDVVAVRCR